MREVVLMYGPLVRADVLLVQDVFIIYGTVVKTDCLEKYSPV